MSLVEYCFNKRERENFTFVIENGVGRYACGTTQEEIDDLYPVPARIYYQNNSDESKNWMQDI